MELELKAWGLVLEWNGNQIEKRGKERRGEEGGGGVSDKQKKTVCRNEEKEMCGDHGGWWKLGRVKSEDSLKSIVRVSCEIAERR